MLPRCGTWLTLQMPESRWIRSSLPGSTLTHHFKTLFLCTVTMECPWLSHIQSYALHFGGPLLLLIPPPFPSCHLSLELTLSHRNNIISLLLLQNSFPQPLISCDLLIFLIVGISVGNKLQKNSMT